jgi:hypothetical protein
MPNTLAHLGINGIATRTFIKKVDLILIYIGALIPDIPWIIQRAVLALVPSINSYDLRLYCVILASLFSSIVLSAALAYLFNNAKRTFIIFSAGCLMHLLLDSIEIKWANGVHLFAPFNWELFNTGFFWPENLPIYVITAFGLVYVIFYMKETLSNSLEIAFKDYKNIFLLFTCLLIYFLLPLLFLSDAEAANNHYVKTLRDVESRTGKYFEVDRGFYSASTKSDEFITPFNEKLKVNNLDLKTSETMSIRAKFLSKNEIQIIEYHIHFNRDIFSYAGLLIVIILFTISVINTYRFRK